MAVLIVLMDVVIRFLNRELSGFESFAYGKGQHIYACALYGW